MAGPFGEVELTLGLLLLMGVLSNVLEGDGALDLFAGKDGLVIPVDEDTYIALSSARPHFGAL